TPRKLIGSIGPNLAVAPYAVFVNDLYPIGGRYKNPTTSGTLPRFLEIGSERAASKVKKRFDKALENITRDLATS
ncbi:hypothetical protein LCGC14_1220820, partial [marine sediment metagenome]